MSTKSKLGVSIVYTAILSFVGCMETMRVKMSDGRRWLSRLFINRRLRCPKQQEINRLRKVLHDIVDSRPDKYMNIEETPELTNWICDACWKMRVETYPSNSIK